MTTNRISRVTTKSGDDGSTSLADGNRYSKGHERIELVGTLDEANASIALVVEVIDREYVSTLRQIQSRLFDIGAAIATQVVQPDVWPREIQNLTSLIEELNAALKPLREFILPGGNEVAGRTHLARTIVRRAERAFWRATSKHDARDNDIGIYLNRVSDYLFVLARVVADEEILWKPIASTN